MCLHKKFTLEFFVESLDLICGSVNGTAQIEPKALNLKQGKMQIILIWNYFKAVTFDNIFPYSICHTFKLESL